jgi:hypothetical protein
MSEIEPAMSAEYWSEEEPAVPGEYNDTIYGLGYCPSLKGLHMLAALALNGQPFGFTWNDVYLLRDTVDRTGDWAHALLNLADRIAALLPPSGTEGAQ